MPYRETPGFPDDPALLAHNVYAETWAGQKTFTTTPQVNAGVESGEGLNHLVSEMYLSSRDMHMLTNGTGLLGNNYNFSPLTFTTQGPFCGLPFFKSATTLQSTICAEYIPVNPLNYYQFALRVQNGDNGGAGYVANSRFYAGVACYDRDRLPITASMYSKVAGSTDTTLAAELKPGDTTVSLTSSTGWGTATASVRQFTWWPYASSEGCVYTPYTYSRNTTQNLATYVTNGGYSSITGTTLNLSSAWPTTFGTLPAGTPVRNSQLGGAYHYFVASSKVSPNSLVKYDGEIGEYNTTGAINLYTKFPYGTSYVRPLVFSNYTTAGATWYFGDLSFSRFNFFHDGVYRDYTPTWSGTLGTPVLGNGLIYGNYAVINKMMWLNLTLILGTTSTYDGTGDWYWSLPAGYTYSTTNPLQIGGCSVNDDSEAGYISGWSYIGAPNTPSIHALVPSSLPNKLDVHVGATQPITWAANDKVRLSVGIRLL